MTTSWDEIRGKIKHSYNEIESAYEKHVVSAVGKVKERPALNTAVKMSLSAIPIIGPNLRDLYDKIGGGTKSEEDKAKQIVEFLSKLEQQNKEQFDRIAEDLKTNRKAIILAINENRITIADLISKSSAELLKEISSVKEDTRVIRRILEEGHSTTSQLRRPPKPSTFRGESKIFVGRKQDIDTVKKYFEESNLPVSITGEGGIGKSELAYKAMHKCESMFDLIIPVYFGSPLTFESFLLEMAKGLNLPINEFEKIPNLEERRQLVTDTLGQGEFKHPLIYADNYETISRVLRMNDVSASALPKEEEEEKGNARKINGFLENLSPNIAILLTSRERNNLDGERPVRLDGLSETEGRDLFIELAKNHFPRGAEPSSEIKRVLEQLSKKAGGHPLSIELLARSYRGQGLSKLREMLERLGIGVVNPKEETERLQSLESCFEYSFNTVPQIHKDLLPKLTLFSSPFPADALEMIFGFEGSSENLLDLYNRSLLRRIEFHEYANDVDTIYHLYYFHLAIRNYLEHKVVGQENKQALQEKYSEEFSLYYAKLLDETLSAIGTKDHVLSLERFNVIFSQGKDNDFDRAIRLAKDRSVARDISTGLGLILNSLGIYSEALEFHNNSLAIDQELQDKVGMSADYTNIGIVLRNQGKYDQSLEYHNKALSIHEELQDKVGMSADYTNIGIVLYSKGDYDQSLEYHNKGLSISEELEHKVRMSAAYGNIGNVLYRKADYDQSLEYHNKALSIHEELQDKVGMTGDYTNIGIVLDDQGKYDQSLEYHNKALSIHEELQDKVGMAKDYRNFANLFYSQGKLEEAIAYFDKLIELNPNDADPLHHKCSALCDLGKLEDAIKCYDKVLEIDPNHVDAWYNKGNALFDSAEYEGAIACFDKAIEIKPDHAAAWNNIGNILIGFAEYEEAIACFDKTIEINPNHVNAWYNKGLALSKSYRNEEAIKCYDKAIELNPNDSGALHDIGNALFDLAEYEGAIAYFDKLIELNPNDVGAWNYKGKALRNLDKDEEAAVCFDKLIELNPNDVDALHDKGRALLDSGRYEEAINCYDKVLQLDPKDIGALHDKGLSFYNLAEYEEAINCYDKAIKIQPNSNPGYYPYWSNKGLALLDSGR